MPRRLSAETLAFIKKHEQDDRTYEVEGCLAEPTDDSPPYGGEKRGESLRVVFADDWNSLELLLCRYPHKKGYTVFGISVNMCGSENSSIGCTHRFQSAVVNFVRSLRSISVPSFAKKSTVLAAIKKALE